MVISDRRKPQMINHKIIIIGFLNKTFIGCIKDASVTTRHRCQPSRNRAGNPANLVVSRIPAFFPKHPAFLGFFGGEKNRRNSQ